VPPGIHHIEPCGDDTDRPCLIAPPIALGLRAVVVASFGWGAIASDVLPQTLGSAPTLYCLSRLKDAVMGCTVDPNR
jgi:hypothetical protein